MNHSDAEREGTDRTSQTPPADAVPANGTIASLLASAEAKKPGAATDVIRPDTVDSTDTDTDVDAGVVAGLDHYTQVLLGRQLKAMFDKIAEGPVPDRFLELLDVLDKNETRR